MFNEKKVVVILSGGIDSTTLMWQMVEQGNEVIALSVDYAQRHSKEIDFAKKLCSLKSVEHYVIDLTSIKALLKNSSLTDSVDVPLGHYKLPSMKVNAVPNRNMVIISLAISCAISNGAGKVVYGSQSGGHITYPDCRPDFVTAISKASELCWYEPVVVSAPFNYMSKTDIIILGEELNVPWEHTWTCYQGGELHCGQCSTCIGRIEAFTLAGVVDPVGYEERKLE